MLRPVMLGVCLWAGALMIASCQRAPHTPLIHGIPFEQALKIVDRNAATLLQIPGVQGIGLSLHGIVVELDHSEVEVPQNIEGLPVTTRDPSGPTSSTPPQSRLLPPPSGVIVLRAGGVREATQHCPVGFTEREVHQWRFCLDPHDLHSPNIPPLWRPHIAGIPYEEALEIWKRRAAALMRISGVAGVVLIANGIVVEAANLDIAIPRNIEGIPVGTRKFPLAMHLAWKPDPCVVSDYEDTIFKLRGENKVSSQHDPCKREWAKVHAEANRRQAEMRERQAVALAQGPDETPPRPEVAQVQEQVDNSLEGLRKRLPPIPAEVLNYRFETPALPPSRMEDIKPCDSSLPPSQGGCRQAPPLATICPEEMVTNAEGLCEWYIPEKSPERKAAEAGIQLPPVPRTIAPGQPADSLICGPGLHFDEPSGRCRRDVPLTEENRAERMRTRKNTVTTVDGREISRKEAQDITMRHAEEVRKLPGYAAGYLDGEGKGLVVELENPFIEGLPKDIEGIPVIPVLRQMRVMLNHTVNTLSIYPSYGAVAFNR